MGSAPPIVGRAFRSLLQDMRALFDRIDNRDLSSTEIVKAPCQDGASALTGRSQGQSDHAARCREAAQAFESSTRMVKKLRQ
jgi:hypothetical protein